MTISDPLPSDLVLCNGAVRTMDPRRPVAQALLLRQGRIALVGDTDTVRAAAHGVQEIDLAGRTAMPGFEDAHLHLCMHGMSLATVRLEHAASLPNALAEVEHAAANRPGGGWLLGSGWDHNLWPRATKPSRHDLDRVVPDRPVALDSKDRHSVWVNSAALRLAGFDAHTPDVAGGQIVRDAAGRPTGILTENARRLIDAHIPEPTPADWRLAAHAAIDDALRHGITAVHSCEGPDAFGALASLERDHALPLRVWHMIPVAHLDAALSLGLRTGFGSDRLCVGHVKMFADGALGSGTAEMLAPYEGSANGYGVAATPTEELLEAVLHAAEGGLASAIHAIGDAANRRVLDVYAAVRDRGYGAPLRQRIEHVQLLSPEDLPRLAALDVIASMQPIHATQDMEMAERQWGARCRNAYAWHSVIESGARLALGSDAPVESLDTMANLYAAVTRRRRDGTPPDGWYPQERLSLDQALHAYTMGGAYAACQEHTRGSLVPGKLADVTVLSRDIHAGPPEALLDTKVDLTIVGGQVVHSR